MIANKEGRVGVRGESCSFMFIYLKPLTLLHSVYHLTCLTYILGEPIKIIKFDIS